MEKNPSGAANPCSHHHPHHHHHHHHHHHQHFQILHSCPLHSYMLQHNNHLPQNPQQMISTAPLMPQNFNLQQISEPNGTFTDFRMTQDEEEDLEYEEEDLEDEAEEPIFVLTDEWREFFAKSEAKRRQAKKHTRKKGKSKMADQQLEAQQRQGTDCNMKSESAICPEIEFVNQQ